MEELKVIFDYKMIRYFVKCYKKFIEQNNIEQNNIINTIKILINNLYLELVKLSLYKKKLYFKKFYKYIIYFERHLKYTYLNTDNNSLYKTILLGDIIFKNYL
jgi:hypothetical protein